jgi:regulator of protease activity HflC (stomatin/prohibitin superfamily)
MARSERQTKSPWVAMSAAGVFVLLTVSALVFRKASGCSAFLGIALAGGIGLVESLLAAAHAFFSRRVQVEREQASLALSGFTSQELFDESRDDALRAAERVSEHYTRYAVPVIAALIGVLGLAFAISGWRSLGAEIGDAEIRYAFQYGVIAIGMFVGCLVLGSFFNGMSREKGGRWLRPTGGWFILSAVLFLAAAVFLFGVQFSPSWVRFDQTVGRIFLVVVGVLAAETVLTVVVEYYRPKIAGQEGFPPFESRILGLFTQPGGIARNLALSLDYQFGFQISEASFYRFLQRSLAPFFLAVGLGLWLLTCIQVIEVDEHGVRERFGRVVAGREQALGPGFYMKLPSPFERIRTFPTGKVQQLDVGYVRGEEDGAATPPDMQAPEIMGDPTGRVIVWSKAHNREETNFVVAAGGAGQTDSSTEYAPGSESGNRAVPVSFISASIPVYYRVSDLYQFLYAHSEAEKTLKDVATREIVAYLASVEFFQVLTERRAESAKLLQERIQAAANRVELGVEIAFVGLEGLHPPVRVGNAFDEVVSASEEMHTEILKSQQYAIRRRPDARIEAFKMTSAAEAYRLQRVRVAQAEAGRFLSQLVAFRASPELYPLRTFLDLLETDAAGIRKFVVSFGDATEVTILNLEEKLRPDLLDVDLEAPEE